jgi:uncharacterized protein (TIGR01777 family)
MKIAVTGAAGFLGRALTTALRERGDTVLAAARKDGAGELRWDPREGFSPKDALSGIDAVVHLAGDNVAEGRWNDARKRSILESRELGTRAVVDAIAAASPRPRVLVSASGVGYYGDRGDDELDETAPAGDDFLAKVCVAWEREAMRAGELGVRVVCMRTGIVLGQGGGPLAKMLPIFKLGLGGRMGSGRQWMPWVHLRDAIAAMLFAIDRADLSGPVNLAAPAPARNAAFAKALARALHRPALAPAPAFALRLVLGEMADVALLAGQRARPQRLQAAGFAFAFTDLDAALENLVG